MNQAISSYRSRYQLLLHAGVLTVTGVLTRAATSLTLLAFSGLYPIDQYAALLPWVACQQLIIMLAPFGAADGLARLMKGRDPTRIDELRAYLPRFVTINLWFAAPLSLALTWLATRRAIAPASVPEACLVVVAGVSVAILLTQQQVMALRGKTTDLTMDRLVGAAVQVVVSFSLAALGASPILAFFLGQLLGASIVIWLRRSAEIASASNRDGGLYWEFLRNGWVFGAWAICGWFSGYGATLLLSHLCDPLTITRYGQAVSVMSLVAYGMGSASTALQARLLRAGADWTNDVQSRLSRVYDASLFLAAAVAAWALASHVEDWTLLRLMGLSWHHGIWLYFFVVYAAYTLYQRTMLPFWYEPGRRLPWTTVAVSEALAFAGYSSALIATGNEPLIANAAMVATRCVSLFAMLPPNNLRSMGSKAATTVLAVFLSALVWICLRLTTT